MTGKPAQPGKPLRVLTFYRLILAGVLATLFLTLKQENPFGVIERDLFGATLAGYTGFSLIAGFATRLRWPAYRLQAIIQVVADVLAVTLLMHASGGAGSSLAVLLIVAVAHGGLLLPGRFAFFFAALATLAVLSESIYGVLKYGIPGSTIVAQAGLLGIVLFGTAGLAYALSNRIRESEALAQRRGLDLADLEQVNQHVIQHLSSGVLVVDHQDRVRLVNQTARQLLGFQADDPRTLQEASPPLWKQLEFWKKNDSWRPEMFETAKGGQTIIPRFGRLNTSHGSGAMIFLDDSSTLAQQSQQIKLASLGHLSASIAHEIRNPLGAISHAAQLLREADHLDTSDQRLIEIINNHCLRVNTIIENVLQLSRRKQAQPQEIELNDWLARFLEEFSETERVPMNQLHLESRESDTTVRCDPDHLHQVLWNLCQNGIRHGGQPSEITLRVREGDGEIVSLDVIDNGQGVAADKVDHIFEPFFTTGAGGTGLGLYLARELCELNHCQLAYQPERAHGGHFRIQFAPADTGTPSD
jgi:two-component system sensor histidine kinase PilS (NtrC family)